MQTEGPEITPMAKQSRAYLPWPLWGLLIAGPAVLALIGCLTKANSLAIFGPLYGSPVAGVIGGAVMGARLGKYPGSKVAFGILFTVLITSLAFGLSFCGCMLGQWRGN
jgi:hypothetical protein